MLIGCLQGLWILSSDLEFKGPSDGIVEGEGSDFFFVGESCVNFVDFMSLEGGLVVWIGT